VPTKAIALLINRQLQLGVLARRGSQPFQRFVSLLDAGKPTNLTLPVSSNLFRVACLYINGG